MAVTLQDTIDKQQHGAIGHVLASQTFWVFLAAVLAFGYLSLATTSFDTPQNLFNVARNCAFVGIIGLGMTAVIITGGIDLSVGAVLCLAGMVAGMMMSWNYPIWIAAPCALAAALACGFVNGFLIAHIGMPPFVVTLAMMSFARSVAMVLSGNQMVYQFGVDHAKMVAIGGGSTRGWFNTMAAAAGPDTALGGFFAWLGQNIFVPNPAIFLIVFALAFGFTFRWTRWGRHIFAIGGNEKAATLTGVPVKRIKVSVYMLSALMAGIAGILQVGWLGTITTGMGTGMELVVIAAVVIGGANLAGGGGTAFGAVVGAVLIEMIRNSLTLLGINPFWQGVFVGSFIITAVAFDRIRASRNPES
ncbi:ABC transporter permease [Mesorhizobium sp. J428]|uniref:ABC transporter permease n=1 Tax=Mesorhizobium sp. J428 TaxID=2898440 RepID=UPI00215144B3|nr:ABC transporter permease [Mesorhizobium sp. J428]MCR5858603.1 ABC transporter permease [Mesorhizobium sp. J428]